MEEVKKEGRRGGRRKLRICDLLYSISSNTVALGIVHSEFPTLQNFYEGDVQVL